MHNSVVVIHAIINFSNSILHIPHYLNQLYRSYTPFCPAMKFIMIFIICLFIIFLFMRIRAVKISCYLTRTVESVPAFFMKYMISLTNFKVVFLFNRLSFFNGSFGKSLQISLWELFYRLESGLFVCQKLLILYLEF